MGHLALGIINERIFPGVGNRCIDAVFLLPVERIKLYRVVDGFVVAIDGALDGVHLRGVYKVCKLVYAAPRGIRLRVRFALYYPLPLLEEGHIAVRHHQQDGEQQECDERFPSHKLSCKDKEIMLNGFRFTLF